MCKISRWYLLYQDDEGIWRGRDSFTDRREAVKWAERYEHQYGFYHKISDVPAPRKI